MRPARTIARLGAIVVVAGLLTGVLTLAGQSVLSAGLNRLANSGAIWLSVAFVVGALMPSARTALVAGVATLLLAIAGYYATAAAVGAGVSTTALLIWGGTAVVGGPVFGVAGERRRHGPPLHGAVASALLGAVFLAEGAFTLLAIPALAPTGWAEVIAGPLITLVLARATGRILLALALLLPLAALGLVAFLAIDRLFLL